MNGLQWKLLLNWMTWGYPQFRKPPKYSMDDRFSAGVELQRAATMLRENARSVYGF